jgi:hypothetical protein
MDEQYYFDQFGVKDDRQTEDEDPGTVAENPEPEEQEQEPAQPAQDEGAGKPKQSKRENAKYAAARREAEKQRDDALQDVEARIAQAREEAARQAKEELLKEQQLENPYTHEEITSIEQYNEYMQMHAQKQKEQRLRELDMTQEEFDDFVNTLPEVQEARQYKQAEQDRQFKEQFNKEIAEISAINPAIQSAEDLARDPKWGEILDMIGEHKNYKLVDAYKLTHFDDLTTRRGRQQAINRQGKSHMTSTVSRGEGAVNVPGDVMDMFRRMNPGVSDEKIAKFYNQQIQNE